MKRQINFDGATYKDWIGLSAAPVFWVASLGCFVLGLAFKQDSGVFIYGIPVDLTLIFSVGLGFANTAIQIVGNDTDRDDMGISLWLMWIASYMLGIGSNVNFLYERIGLSSPILQFLVCWGLGVMIEVAPERLLVKFLRAIGLMGQVKVPQTQQRTTPQNTTQSREQRHEEIRRQSHTPQPVAQNSEEWFPVHPDFGGRNGGEANVAQRQANSRQESLPPFLVGKGQNKNGTVQR